MVPALFCPSATVPGLWLLLGLGDASAACKLRSLAAFYVKHSPYIPATTHPPTELHCYVSPVLRQIRLSTSRIEAEQWVGACGGSGCIALEVRGARAEAKGKGDGGGRRWEVGGALVCT